MRNPENTSYRKEFCLLIVLLFIMYVVLLPRQMHTFDVGIWKRWMVHIFNNGLSDIYNTTANYPPVYMYFAYLFGKFQGSVEFIDRYLYFSKLIPLFFDFVGAISILLLLKNNTKKYIFPFCLLLNIGYLYNSIYWGQIDSLYTTFTLLAFIFAFRQQVVWSTVFYMLAINSKLQAIIFFPILGLLLLPLVIKSIKKIGQVILTITVSQIIIFLPFLLNGTGQNALKVYGTAVDLYTKVSQSAWNFWWLILEERPDKITDDQIFYIWSYKAWGISLFLICSTIILVPLLLKSFQAVLDRSKFDNRFFELSFLCATLVTIAFFSFPTQMHERYIHASILLSFCYGIYSKKYGIHIICSIAYFLHLEGIMHFFNLSNYKTLVWQPNFVASLFLLSLLIGLIHLYRDFDLRKTWTQIKQGLSWH